MSGLVVRDAAAGDAAAINQIFDHYAATSHVTFDSFPMSSAERIEWIGLESASQPRLVAEEDGRVVGWAAAKPFSAREAYRYSVEVSVYVRDGSTGRGIGRRLVTALLERLQGSEAHRVYAIVGLPNDESIRLFEALGFTACARLSEAGRKFGGWWDVAWYEYRI